MQIISLRSSTTGNITINFEYHEIKALATAVFEAAEKNSDWEKLSTQFQKLQTLVKLGSIDFEAEGIE